MAQALLKIGFFVFEAFAGAAAAATLGAGAAVAIGAAVVVGGTLVAKHAMSLFEVEMPTVDTDASRQRTVRSTTEPQKIIYGEALVSGPISFIGLSGTDNSDLYQTIVLAGHELNDITDIHMDDVVITDSQINGGSDAGGNVTAGKFGPKGSPSTTICVIKKHLGEASQTADVLLTGPFANYTSAHRGDGIAYLAMKWVLNDDSAETWDKFAPSNVRALVKGKSVYDPRTDTTVYSDNPALCLADYLTDTILGMGIPTSKIDWDAVEIAAEGCDASVPVPGGTEKRFTCNGVVFATDSHQKNINKILSSMNGNLVYSNGKYIVHAGIYEDETIQEPFETLNEDDLIGAISIKTSLERSDRFNTIKGLFIDPAQNHKSSEFPKVQLADAVTRDNNEILEKEVQYPMTNSSYMAQRLSHKLIKLSDQQKVISFPANLAALRITAGDRVKVSIEELSWSNKVFQCVGWTFSEEGGVNLTLREDSESAYDDPTVTPDNEYSTITATGDITDAFRGVPSPSGLTVTPGLKSNELNWVNPGKTNDFGTIYVYASRNANFSSAIKIGETDGTQFIHDGSNKSLIFFPSVVNVGDTYTIRTLGNTDFTAMGAASNTVGVVFTATATGSGTGNLWETIAPGNLRYYWVRAVKNVGTDDASRSGLEPPNDPNTTVFATVGAVEVDWDNVADPTIGIDINNDTISINTGVANTTTGQDVATSGIEAGTTITQGGITMNQGGSIKGGQSAYNSGTGFFLGYDTNAYKFSIGNSNTEALTFDGTNLAVTGAITATSGSIANSVTVGGTAASTVASEAAAGNQAADQISLLPRADDSEWTVGTGAKGIWSLNGGTTENAVVVENGPHGELERIWKATSTDGSGPDGGFQNTSTANQFPIVSDTTYRFSVFIKQDNTNGSIYLGAYNFGGGSTLSLYRYDGTGANTNKYWFSSDLPTQGEWYLLVGFINPSNTNSNSGKGGIYNLATGVKVTAFDDFRFSGDGSETDATTFSVRTYNYYGVSTPTSIVRWAHPRVDRLDRRAPSIAELLRGWTSLAEPINAGVTITGGGITMDSGGAIKGGQSAYNSGTGFFLGYDTDAYKFSIGNAGNNSLAFDGTNLAITGAITATSLTLSGITIPKTDLATGVQTSLGSADSAIQDADTSVNLGLNAGSVGGITINSASLTSGSHTTYGSTAQGFFLGSDGSMSFADGTNQTLTIDTSGNLSVTGTVNASAGAFTGDVSTGAKFIAGADASTVTLDGTTGANYSIFAGADNSLDASFKVASDGVVEATRFIIRDDANGQVLIDTSNTANPFSGVVYTSISQGSGAGVDTVAGTLADNAGEITITTTKAETFLITAKVAIDDNDGSTNNISGASTTSTTDAENQLKGADLKIEYYLKEGAGAYALEDTEIVTFTEGTPSPSQIKVFGVDRGAGYSGSFTRYFAVIQGGGAAEFVTYFSTSSNANRARTYAVTTASISISGAGTHKIKILARLVDAGTNTTLTNSTTPALVNNNATGTYGGSGIVLDAAQSPPNQSSLDNFKRIYEATSANGFVVSAANTFAIGEGTTILTSGGTISGDLVITGDLTVQGTTTTINVADLTVADKDITLNYSTGDSSSTANNAGIIIQDAVNSTTDASILWKTASDTFEFSHKLIAPNLDINKNVTTTSTNGAFDVSKSLLGNIHITNGAGASGTPKEAAITFQGGGATEAQAGIYVVNDNSSGTHMAFATTGSYATGPQIAINITSAGVVNFPRARPTYSGSGLWASSDFSSTQITQWDTAYTYSQVGHLPLAGGTLTGVVQNTNNANADGPNFNVSTTNKSVAEYAYRVDRSDSVVGGIRIDGRLIGPDAVIGGATVSASAIGNWNTAYTYSQVGHLPLAGGTLTGALSGTSGAFTGAISGASFELSGISVIDANQNINAASISTDAITSTGDITLTSTTASSPSVNFNSSTATDPNVDMAIKLVGEELHFYEPEDTNKVHFKIYDDTGVDAPFGYWVNGTRMADVSRNLTVGTITSSGNFSLNQADGFVYLNNQGTGNAGIYVRGITSSSTLRSHSTDNFRWEVTGSQKMELDSSGILNAVGGYQVNGTTVIDASRNLTSINQITSQGLTRTNNRINSAQDYPVGHYTPSDTVFEIDPTWSEAELASFFGGGNVTWTADSTAPAGYAIYINGGVNVGGVYGSGFPFIPVGTSDIFYMECWIKNVGTSQTHYMGSNEYNQNFGNLGGNPGSYGYWVMSNTNVGSSWAKVSGYITGFGNAVGQFETGTKYWTPLALFNYGAGTGTRACVISGWKVIKVNASGNRTFEGTISSGAITSSGSSQLQALTIKGGAATTTESVLTFENAYDTAHIKSKYTNPSATTETYLAFYTNKAGETNGTVLESMRLSGNNLSVNGTISSGAITSTELTITGGADGADVYINNSSPTLAFTDSNSFSDANDMYIIRGASTGKLQFNWYDYSANTTTQTFLIDQSGNATFAGTISSGAITSTGQIYGNRGQVWSATTQGKSTGSIHLDPDTATNDAGSAITFGASDTGGGANAQAGIYIRSDSGYGTRMYLSTTDSYAVGSKTAISIDHAGNVSLDRGNLQMSGVLLADQSRNLTNIGTISVGQASNSFGASFEALGTDAKVQVHYLSNSRGGIAAFSTQRIALYTTSSFDDIVFGYSTNATGASFVQKMKLDNGTGELTVSGAITASGNITAYSDERLKENIQTLDGSKVLQMRGVSFTKDGESGSGVIAQELEKIAPELVHDGEYKSVAYGNLVGYLIENAKQQQSEIDELKALVKQLMEK